MIQDQQPASASTGFVDWLRGGRRAPGSPQATFEEEQHQGTAPRPSAGGLIEALDVSRRFGEHIALDRVSLTIAGGEISALLGPNGAGKTTLLRILCGLLDPHAGSVRVLGFDTMRSPKALRQRIGLIPSGDRTFYLRVSGLENLVFFARLHGLSRRDAVTRSLEVLEQVGLRGTERQRAGTYSHGMQKRLAVARALLLDPDVMLIDEATHDLDPEGASQVRDLVGDLARRGAAVLWTTQRLDEIRGFADSVTLLNGGRVRFAGSVPELMSHASPRRYLLHVQNGSASGKALEPMLQAALANLGTISTVSEESGSDFVLVLDEQTALGDALRSLLDADVQIYACREEKSQIEDAFMRLTRASTGAADE